MTSAAFVFLLAAVPQGYAIDCRSWPGNIRADVIIHLVAVDGSKFSCQVGFGKDSTAQSVQVTLWAALGDSKWPVRFGENGAVIVFGPKGQSLRSITFESAEWVPVHHRYFGR